MHKLIDVQDGAKILALGNIGSGLRKALQLWLKNIKTRKISFKIYLNVSLI